MPMDANRHNRRAARHSRACCPVLAVLLLAVSFAAGSCSKNKQLVTDAVVERDSMSVMTTHGVNSLISDSGVIRYKILADEWLVYDKRNPPYWAFERGVYLEKFDTLHRVEARIKADTAYYNTDAEIWTLRGNVHIESLKGERFDTQLMYWNQKTQRVYSDRYIRIEQPERTITGYGFDSNQQMTEYVIRNITGIFYVDESEEDTVGSEAKGDTAMAVARRDSAIVAPSASGGG